MSAPRRLMGLDVGSRRVGIAIGDELGIVATPIGFIQPGPQDRAEFTNLVERHGITELIVGIPRTMSGTVGPQAKEVRAYANALALDLNLPLTYWDERLTTVIAERNLISSGRSRQQRRAEIDAAAAAVMLQGYLDFQAGQIRRNAGTDSAILDEVADPHDRDRE
jgi:putative holliday junction resolvase